MFDPIKNDQRLLRALRQHTPDADVLVRFATEELMDRLSAVQRTFETGVAAFARTPVLQEAMINTAKIENTLRLEELNHVGEAGLISSLEAIPFSPASIDLFLAPFSLHWSNDLPGTLLQIARALRPDGLLMVALPGPLTLQELREALLQAESETTEGAARRVDPFTEVRDAGALLQRAGFALPVTDQETITLRYDGVQNLIADLRAFAATNRMAKSGPNIKRTTWKRVEEIYTDRFSDADGRVRASFQIVWMSAWSPHESQQKPLKPGSAKQRLADALGTSEKKL